NLTVEAARLAGLEDLTLLEEPQAAFYCWLATHSAAEAAAIKPGARCVVVDVGGGTSDFSLIQAVEQQGELGFVRQAVGDHLLLGGDNMDLALAKFVETKLPGAGRLDAAQYGMLTQACRQAKETLLGPRPGGDRRHAAHDAGPGRRAADHLRRLLPRRAARRRADARGANGFARDGLALRQRPGRHPPPGGLPQAAHASPLTPNPSPPR